MERIIRWTTGRETRHVMVLIRMLVPVLIASAFLNNTREWQLSLEALMPCWISASLTEVLGLVRFYARR